MSCGRLSLKIEKKKLNYHVKNINNVNYSTSEII